jgi:hypothetical protein
VQCILLHGTFQVTGLTVGADGWLNLPGYILSTTTSIVLGSRGLNAPNGFLTSLWLLPSPLSTAQIEQPTLASLAADLYAAQKLSNKSPVIGSITQTPAAGVFVKGKVTFAVEANDADGDTIKLRLTAFGVPDR